MLKKSLSSSLVVILILALTLTGCGGGSNGGGTPTVIFESVVQSGGISGTADTKSLKLKFSKDPGSLTRDHILVTGATKGELRGTGEERILDIYNITVSDGEEVSVAFANPPGYAITGSPKTVVVYRALYIGMPYQGGKIAYIFQPGDPGYEENKAHGLIAATADQSDGIVWTPHLVAIRNTKTELGTGQENTTRILNRVGPSDTSAAKLCNDYTNPDTGTGEYSDWFLPSKDELDKLYLNKNLIGGFADGKYWSSTEKDTSESAYSLDFSNGVWEYSGKNTNLRVRAIRYF